MITYNQVVNALPLPDGNEVTVKKYQETGDIIKDLIFCFKEYHSQAKPLVPIFSTGDIHRDGKRIWQFIKYNIPYNAEPEKRQTTASLRRIIHDAKKQGHDCKHSALIASTLAWQLGYTVMFRFVNYDKYNDNYGHVYTIIQNPKTGKWVVIDPLQPFDYQKPFKAHKDYKAINKNNNMELKQIGTLSRLTGDNDKLPVIAGEYEMSGIGDIYEVNGMASLHMISQSDLQGVGKTKAKARALLNPLLRTTSSHTKDAAKNLLHKGQKNIKKRTIKKLSPSAHKAKKDKRKKKPHVKLKDKIKARGGAFKAFAGAPLRLAINTLLLANFRNFAGRLQKASPEKVAAFAKKFGYKGTDNLMKNINKGAKHKPTFGSKQNGMAGVDDTFEIQGIGVIALATAIATAAPAIIAITHLLKGEGLEEPGDTEAAVESAEAVRTAPDQSADAAEEQQLNEEAPEGSEEEAPAEEEEGGEAQNGTKGKKVLEAIENTAKATQAASKAYAKSTAAAKTSADAAKTKAQHSKEAAEKLEQDAAHTWFDNMKESVKEKPLVWLGGTAALIYFGGKAVKFARK